MDRCLKMFACSVCETWGGGGGGVGGWDAKCFTLTLELMTYFQFIIYHVVADVYTICVYFNGTCTNIVCIAPLVVYLLPLSYV